MLKQFFPLHWKLNPDFNLFPAGLFVLILFSGKLSIGFNHQLKSFFKILPSFFKGSSLSIYPANFLYPTNPEPTPLFKYRGKPALHFGFRGSFKLNFHFQFYFKTKPNSLQAKTDKRVNLNLYSFIKILLQSAYRQVKAGSQTFWKVSYWFL